MDEDDIVFGLLIVLGFLLGFLFCLIFFSSGNARVLDIETYATNICEAEGLDVESYKWSKSDISISRMPYVVCTANKVSIYGGYITKNE